MNSREKLLGGCVLALLVMFGARSVHNRFSGVYERYAKQANALRGDLREAEALVSGGMKAADFLAEWRYRSLPSDESFSTFLYQAWLYDRLGEAGLASDDVPVTSTPNPSDGYTRLKSTINAEGDLAAITRFLFHFYQSHYLHKISSLVLTPDDAGKRIGVTMTIDALALEDADSEFELVEGTSKRLAHEVVDPYLDIIVERNIFAVYTDPVTQPVVAQVADPSPSPPPEPPFDHAKHAFINGIVESDGHLQVWINVRTTGKKHWLAEGESLKVGEFECRVVEIHPRGVVFEADGKRYLVKLGKTLRDGQPLPDQAT